MLSEPTTARHYSSGIHGGEPRSRAGPEVVAGATDCRAGEANLLECVVPRSAGWLWLAGRATRPYRCRDPTRSASADVALSVTGTLRS